MWKRRVLRSLFFLLPLPWAGTAAVLADRWKDESRSRDERESDSYFHRHGYLSLGIPEGHLPPPGECRIWYPGRPAGEQPPPGKCRRLPHDAPPGAWLILRPKKDREHVEVSVYDQRRPGIVVTIGLFKAGTGAFVRLVGPG